MEDFVLNTVDIFTRCETNIDKYYREVRRCLYVNMGESERPTLGIYNAFCRRYAREGGMYNKENCRPKFDAWCLVRGTSRIVFNHKRFFERYPSAKKQINLIRGNLKINVKDNLS